MKNNIYLHFATLILVGVFGVTTHAQSRNRQQLRVNVPFAFNVGNTLLPAGDYNVRIVNPSSDRSVVQISSLDGRLTRMSQTTDTIGRSTTKARLMFRQYGDHFFLAQVWMASESNGLVTRSSNLERTLRQQLGKTGEKLNLVAVDAH